MALQGRGERADGTSVAAHLGPTRPDRLTIWPLDDRGFGIDVRWSGGEGNRRAAIVRKLLEEAGIRARLMQHPDGSGWELRVGPIPGADVAGVIDQFVW
jgi:hypothetical protein